MSMYSARPLTSLHALRSTIGIYALCSLKTLVDCDTPGRFAVV